MAYTLESVITILQKILNPDQKLWDFDVVKPQLESLQEIATSLKKILQASVLESGAKMERIERQIQEAAHEAEDIIESHIVNQMIPESRSFTISPPELKQVIQELHFVMGSVTKIIHENRLKSTNTAAAAAAAAPRSKSVVVGVEKDLEQLKDRLTGMQRKLEIVSIVGMGGIGKTTLARRLYQDPSIVSYFQYARAWATISQDYNMKAILLELLRCIIGKEAVDQHNKKDDSELKDILYRSLFGRKYLIVLDDIWSNKFWDEMRKYFPDSNNGSRVVITTRESDVAKYADSQSLQHQVQLLSESLSCHLLNQIVFGEECSAHVLYEIGEKIARDCGGLPLAISVIGGLLSKVERSQDVWERIASDVKAAIADSDEQFSNIMSLSYNHLPYHLKPCFLYMAAFPEDEDIRTSTLTSLWVAEGFVKANGNSKSLEEEAEGYLTALVERNLLIVKENGSNWKAKSYGTHDLMRDLCIRKAEEQEFLHRAIVPKSTFYSPRRLYVNSRLPSADGRLALSFTRSLICNNKDSFEDLSSSFHVSRLVKVLDMWNVGISDPFPMEILQLVNLHYLRMKCDAGLPLRQISQAFWNLQTLIIAPSAYSISVGAFDYTKAASDNSDFVEIPAEVWEMPHLRRIKFCGGVIRYAGYNRLSSVREKMQKISMIQLNRLQEVYFFTTFPCIRSLKLDSFSRDSYGRGGVRLDHLGKLEKLRCSSVRPLTNEFLSSLRLPSSLKKLTLDECAVPKEFMASLCHLQHLQILRIGNSCEFTNEDGTSAPEWEVGEGDEFRSLQFLFFHNLSLKRWAADETNFPKLRHLLLVQCYSLEEIPSGIGEILTLQLIEIFGCSDSAVESAKQIVEEQQSDYGNYDLQLLVDQ